MRSIIKKRWGLTVSLVLFIFFILLIAIAITGTLFIFLHHVGILDIFSEGRPDNPGGGGGPFLGIFPMLIFSVFLGTLIAAFFSKIALRPIRKIIEATHMVASGDFNVKLDIHSIYELEELSRSFNKMTQELSSIETLRSDFINNLSHEFKTPIVSIKGFAELLSEGGLTENEQREYLDIIIAESKRLAYLSTNVLNLTKVENLEIVTEIATFQLDEQVRKAVLQLEAGWVSKNITVDIETDDIEYTGSPDLTQQILLNLIDNAIKFSHEGGVITIRLSDRDDTFLLSIKDNGIGMDDQTLSQIFDKFYQGDSSRAKEGNGLGLSIVKRIVDLCGGTIKATSTQNKGSEFVISLPK